MSDSEWKEARLGDEIELLYGKSLVKTKRNDKGNVPVYGSSGIVGFHDEPLVNGPGVIIGRKGTVGSINYSSRPFYPIDTTYYLDPQNNDLKFMYYFMHTVGLSTMNTHSAVPGLNRDNVYNLIVRLPELSEQKLIAATLSALDDMIELNHQINKTLEEMAQAIFKSWFVDFEPFRDGEFEESELGLIPKVWRVGKLSDVGEIIGGGTPSKSKPEYYSEIGIPWITPKDLSINKNKYISRGEIDISELGLRESSARLMPKGTVLFSSRAPIGYIAIAKNAVTTNQGFKSVVPFENISSEYIYLLLKNSINEIEGRATGSTFKEISGGEMKKVPIILPPKEIIRKFNEIATTLGKTQASLEDENNILMSIRDTLLPKLMSGEIRVPVEEVV